MNARPWLAEAAAALPLDPLRGALAGVPAYLVGGAVRSLVAGEPPGRDLDVAVAGNLDPLLARLAVAGDIEVHDHHRRFGTATVALGGRRIDLTRTRRETYARPGALPAVEPAGIEADLVRRDFTVNAMALPLDSPGELLDPFGGEADLQRRTLRVLHARSFVDDPTRAIRAARYASRLRLSPEPQTRALLAATDLGTVSADRRATELARLAGEASAPEGFRLLAEWGVLSLPEEALALIAAIDRLAAKDPWAGDGETRREAILLAAAAGPRAEAAALAQAAPGRPSEAVALGSGHSPAELRAVRLEIGGEDLRRAGIPEGPAIGAGLRAALTRKLDGELSGGREAELAAALAAAREAI